MKASIIIPAFNEEKALPQLFGCLQAQSFRDFEVIVADASSSDGTRTVATDFGARVVAGGLPGVGRNRGADVARGELLIFFDADVVLTSENFLLDVIGEIERRKLLVATCSIKAISNRWADTLMVGFYNGYTRLTAPVLPHAAGFCILVKREIHEKIRGFDEQVVFAEDMEYARRAARLGKFGILQSHKMPMSVRRFERDGRFRTAARFMLAEIYMITRGGIRTDVFKYRFGHQPTKVTPDQRYHALEHGSGYEDI